MKKENYYPPKHAESKFHCPNCNVFSMQFWASLNARGNHFQTRRNPYLEGLAPFNEELNDNWTISKCQHCLNVTVWLQDRMVYPQCIFVQSPNEDLSEDIKTDYLEAAKIINDSPRSSAALLRLALQKLCKQLGEKGENINDDIKNLVKKGLNLQIQKSLDILRITGNNAVHPGEINLDENPELVLRLFDLINFIAEKMVTEPKEIDSFYSELPESSKEAINKRDAS